jgi:hypothetical protein
MNTPIGPPPNDTTAPTVPSNLTAAAASSSRIGLSWSASTDNVGVAGYKIFRNGTQVATSTPTTYQDSGLAPNTTYGYAVSAFDAAGNVSARSLSASATTLAATTPPSYPLKISADGRHLLDQNNAPFLVQGDSAWSLIASLNDADTERYLENRRLKGFNTVLVNLLEHKFTDNAPKNAAGDGPFLTPGDFSTPNEAYFAHADHVIQNAASKGILVLLTPAYLGYQGGDEGWYSEMSANGATKLRNYGRYLGNRYKNVPNILRVEAGDYIPPNHTLVNAVALGILDNDQAHLHTAHCERGTSASDCFGNEAWLNVNSSYTNYTTYDHIYRDYSRTPFRPFFFIEGVYENEGSTTPTVIRAEAYRSILSGSQGQLFGNDPIWSFDGPTLYPPPYTWQVAMDAQGSRDMSRVNPVFASRDWSNLVPDRTHVVVTAGYGTYTTDESQVTNDYATTARTPDGRLAMTYMPSRRAITVDMTKFSGPVTAKWYDPTNGAYTTVTGSPFANTGTRTFTPTGNNSAGNGDWVLVLETGS